MFLIITIAECIVKMLKEIVLSRIKIGEWDRITVHMEYGKPFEREEEDISKGKYTLKG